MGAIWVSVVTRLRAGRSRVWIPAGDRRFCLLQNLQTSSVAFPASYSMETWVFFPGGRAWDWGLGLATHLNLVPRLRMGGSIPPLPLYEFVACIRTVLPFTYHMRRDHPSELAHVRGFTAFTHSVCYLSILLKDWFRPFSWKWPPLFAWLFVLRFTGKLFWSRIRRTKHFITCAWFLQV
jgi:hypothetical protein